MAFADAYGYRTNVTDVVAFAEGDEYANPDYTDPGAGEAVDEAGNTATLVDLVLTGQSSGGARRTGVPVSTAADAVANQAFPA